MLKTVSVIAWIMFLFSFMIVVLSETKSRGAECMPSVEKIALLLASISFFVGMLTAFVINDDESK